MDPDSPTTKYVLTTKVTRDADGQEILGKGDRVAQWVPLERDFCGGIWE